MSNFRNAIIDSIILVVRKDPSFTLGQLCDPSVVGLDLRDVLLTRLVASSAPSYSPVAKEAGPETEPKVSTHRVKTAKKSDQKAFDAAVIYAVVDGIGQDPAKWTGWTSSDIAHRLDHRGHGIANLQQIRASMKRLRSRKQVKQSGKARGTRYTATAKGVKAFEKMGAA